MVAIKLSSQVPIKVVIMNRHYIQVSGAIVSGQVSRYQVKCISIKYLMSVSGKLNIEPQYHMSTRITMHHVLKARIAIIRHVTVIIRHSHINISCNKR